MSATPKDREAHAIATLVALHLDGPEEWMPEHYDTAEAAAREAAHWVRRDGRAGRQEAAAAPVKARTAQRRKPHLEIPAESRRAVQERSRGCCEAPTPACQNKGVHQAEHMHHKRGRRGDDPHAPEKLLHVCLLAHDYIHAHPEESYAEGWMVKRLGVGS